MGQVPHMNLNMPAIPSQWQFSEIMKFFIDLGNAQWVDASGVDEQQDAFDLYEHLVSPTKQDDVEPDSYVGKPDAAGVAG